MKTTSCHTDSVAPQQAFGVNNERMGKKNVGLISFVCPLEARGKQGKPWRAKLAATTATLNARNDGWWRSRSKVVGLRGLFCGGWRGLGRGGGIVRFERGERGLSSRERRRALGKAASTTAGKAKSPPLQEPQGWGTPRPRGEKSLRGKGGIRGQERKADPSSPFAKRRATGFGMTGGGWGRRPSTGFRGVPLSVTDAEQFSLTANHPRRSFS